MSRYPMAEWRPTPKHGYPQGDSHQHRGVVVHSVEGTLAGAFSVLDGPREASWHFTVAKDGRVFQHVNTNNIAWTNGSHEANRRFWGIECEGGGPGNLGEPLTSLQLAALIDVLRWLWRTHEVGPPERQVTLWEHNEMTRFGASPTSCPSGRIPWSEIIFVLEEDDMGIDADLREVVKTIQGQVNQLLDIHKAEGNEHHAHLKIVQGQVDQLLDIHRGPHGQPVAGGFTPQEIADALEIEGILKVRR